MKIGCELCGKWFHIQCQNVPEAVWSTITESDQIHWFCQECNKNAPEIMSIANKAAENKKNIEKVQKQVEGVEQDVQSIKNGTDPTFLETLKKAIIEAMEDETDQVFREALKKVVEETYEGIEDGETGQSRQSREAVKKIAIREIRENNDRKGRECNLVVSGIDEEKEAEEAIPSILSALGVTVEVEAIRRMGRDKEEGKTRLVWVQLSSKSQRNSVLEKAKKLKQIDEWKTVYINKDMTEAERKQAYQLRKALRDRRDKEREEGGSRVFVIHRGRIIEKATNREPADEDGSSDEED